MSPEQAAGRWDELGPASDIYGLGATLYALLTGGAPFGDGESMDVLARVVKGDFSAPRAINKQVPRALEAICLKAMALKPADRYPSARALADDVERWLNDQPVSVYHDPLSRRCARWVRNHKGTSGAVAAAVVVLMVTSGMALAIGRRANERTRAQGLVETLVNADPQQVPDVIEQLGRYTTWAGPMMAEKLAQAKTAIT